MDFTRWILFVWINISLTNAEIKVKLSENRKQAKKMHRHRTVHQKKSAANGGKPPRIGDNVYLGPGSKVFGDIELADGVMVGANAVVNHSCMEAGAHLVGIPAKAVPSSLSC